ncbi:hypothetical protein EE612_059556 [Oryza sativa]|nr:hypothetical protein EE612_059556 [Oryza sativa]
MDQRQPHELTTHIVSKPFMEIIVVGHGVLTGSAPLGARTTCRPRAPAAAAPPPPPPPPPTPTTKALGLGGAPTAAAPVAADRPPTLMGLRPPHGGRRFLAVSGETTTASPAPTGRARAAATGRRRGGAVISSGCCCCGCSCGGGGGGAAAVSLLWRWGCEGSCAMDLRKHHDDGGGGGCWLLSLLLLPLVVSKTVSWRRRTSTAAGPWAWRCGRSNVTILSCLLPSCGVAPRRGRHHHGMGGDRSIDERRKKKKRRRMFKGEEWLSYIGRQAHLMHTLITFSNLSHSQ